MLLENINSPADVKKLDSAQLGELAGELRNALMNRLSKHGGHFGPNFGMVEATIALHYVFDSPKDKFVFDVSHQSYCHKMLTGRKDAYLYDEHFDDISGYTNPEESEHDFFNVGHTSTSVSLATGLAKARDFKGETGNVVAVIGDGSLSGGEALEGIDFAGEMDSNFIVLFNDNDMSIAENHGGLYKNLRQLRESNGTCECNLFKAMGLDYMYVNEGNDIQKLIEAFEKVKDIDHPIVVHINTLKGKGYKIAEETKQVDIKEEAEKLVKNVSENVEKTKVSEKIVENQAVKTETKVEVMSHEEIERRIRTFLADMFKAMDMKVEVKINFNEKDECVDVELLGDNMGVLIGKRGQTLDSIQYLISLVVNKGKEKYVRIKVDTENYRNRRKETLESLARNIAYKVKRSKSHVSLEPMNPYERRIIHAALQNDKYVSTKSEGEEPFRHVVIFIDKNKADNKR